ncbi:MAG TPA: EAL domain-containing protein [Streptosporangiaceae bacterium]|jgi:diguanylate cyclase (GGDEF)-like protein
MKDPNDTRDMGPRVGSPLWIHLMTVTAAGAVAFTFAMLHLHGLVPRPDGLVWHPLFWLLAALVLVGDIWPIITPGRSGPESPVASLTFSFAALLYWGLPVAVLMKAASTLAVGLAERKAVKRSAFNAAQVTLSMCAAWLVLLAFHLHPTPTTPWDPNGRELLVVLPAAAAFFAVNFVLVGIAIALHSRASLLKTLRGNLPYQAFVNLVLLATAPLVAVVMSTGSALLLLLFAFPLAAIYANAAMSVQREHQAHHDELTGLSNRKLLIRRTNDALAQAARSQTMVGFLLLDLDRFKEVNDTLGHPVGDRLLRHVAHRLTHSVRPGDMVARLGGDEFAVLLPSVKEAAAAREVAARLRAAVSEPIRMDGMSFDIEASVGIALYPDDASGFEVLLQHADVAMYLAKERRSGVERYVADSDRNSPARLALLGDLRRGLDRGELELHFQPKVFLADRSTAGMEALVRWQHPARGLMAPEEFIPLIEQSYLMRELTARVIDMALSQAALWWQSGMSVQVSLNLAARDLIDNGLADIVGRGLQRHGLPADALLLEIDERVLTSEPAHAVATAEALAALGVSLSLDDFGTGYSSLVRLKRLPVSEVKIDSSFVGRLLHSADDQVIVRSIVDLVGALGIRSVAEGVESAEVAAALVAMGCAAAQGWYFSKPLNAASATAWLAEREAPADGLVRERKREPIAPAASAQPVTGAVPPTI